MEALAIVIVGYYLIQAVDRLCTAIEDAADEIASAIEEHK